MRRALGWVALVGAAAAALGGCSGDARNPALPEPSAPPPAAAALAGLAGEAGTTALVASYATVASDGRHGVVTIAFDPPDTYRVDVAAGGVVASLYHSAAGSVSCRQPANRHTRALCVRVAGPGAALPSLFDPGVERLFTVDLDVLGVRPDAFSVTEVAGVPAAGGLPAARCFAVVPASPPPSPAVPGLAEVDPGTYCLSA
ncbi:MAG: hypothetical protein ACYDAQ_02850, partial [Mycobacteriales bacterium]